MPPGPLTPEHKDQIDIALEGAASVKETIDRAKLAGIDLQGKDERLVQVSKRLRAIRDAFFPNE